MELRDDQLEQWRAQGCLHLRGFFDPSELAAWTDELAQWPETPGRWMKYFEPAADGGDPRMLCRVENFLEYHEGWRGLLQSPGLLRVLEQLFGEPAVLFKEKINFKQPGGSGFTAHQDAPAFAAFGQRFHITAMVSIDASHPGNGCLEMAYGRHQSGLLEMDEGQSLAERVIEQERWEPVPTEPGDLVLFGSFLPHRSGPNRSEAPRRAAYLTYNGVSEGERRDAYYEDKRRVFPPEIERVPGQDYSNTGMYNIGNPIQT